MKKSKLINDEGGYTIIETVVALVLLLLLLFFTNEFLHFLTLNKTVTEDLIAVTAAKNQMELVLLTNDYIDRELELEKGLLLKQTVSLENGLRRIDIKVFKSEHIVYELFCHVPIEDQK